MQFEPVDGSSKHLMIQLITGERAQLTSDLTGYFEAMKTCPVDPKGANGAFLSVADVALPELGDQRQAVGIRAQENGTGPVWFVRAAQVRVGALIVAVGLTEILETPDQVPAISDSDFGTLVQAAVTKASA